MAFGVAKPAALVTVTAATATTTATAAPVVIVAATRLVAAAALASAAAALAPPSAAEIAQARQLEAGTDTARANAAEPALAPDARKTHRPSLMTGAVLGAIGAVLVMAVFILVARHQ